MLAGLGLNWQVFRAGGYKMVTLKINFGRKIQNSIQKY
jgi:hypothetical protein